ncbi:unnamed protein product [Cochlearia groenlandica]
MIKFNANEVNHVFNTVKRPSIHKLPSVEEDTEVAKTGYDTYGIAHPPILYRYKRKKVQKVSARDDIGPLEVGDTKGEASGLGLI